MRHYKYIILPFAQAVKYAIISFMGVGLVRYLTGTLGQVVDPPLMEVHELQAVSLFLILHAFSSGTTSLTGVEAISNGITAFREPRK